MMPLKPKNVLVVDDDPLQLEIVKDYLQELGTTRIQCVLSGHEAISILRRSQGSELDLIITDVCMPPPDGIDLLRFLAGQEISIPVILMSGSTESMLKSVAEFAKSSQVELLGTLAKPFAEDDLKELLDTGSRASTPSSVSLVEVTQKSALVVDDDPILFETAAAVLRIRGISEITHAPTISAAVEHLQSGSPTGLIILDLNMPDTDGVEFLSELREHSSDVPIVISSSAHDSVREAAFRLAKAYGLDARGAVSKPFTLEKLDKILN